jgi:hypothetical protein
VVLSGAPTATDRFQGQLRGAVCLLDRPLQQRDDLGAQRAALGFCSLFQTPIQILGNISYV